jgi:CDP-diacylglycerol--glycerol-3-phosphate 3-phosphatidyltransferase
MFDACSRTIVGTMVTSLGEAGGAPAPLPTRERFWNLPNTITVVRMAVVPVLLAFPLYPGTVASRVVAWTFIVAAFGDLLDGWAARRGSQVTKIGKLLDPLADKLTVSTALIVLLTMGRIPEWGLVLVVVVIGRELAVTGLRGIASAGGQVVAAGWQGKLKTTAQNIAIGCLLFPEGTLGVPNHALGVTLLAVATALTLWSGYVYFADYFAGEARG